MRCVGPDDQGSEAALPNKAGAALGRPPCAITVMSHTTTEVASGTRAARAEGGSIEQSHGSKWRPPNNASLENRPSKCNMPIQTAPGANMAAQTSRWQLLTASVNRRGNRSRPGAVRTPRAVEPGLPIPLLAGQAADHGRARRSAVTSCAPVGEGGQSPSPLTPRAPEGEAMDIFRASAWRSACSHSCAARHARSRGWSGAHADIERGRRPLVLLIIGAAGLLLSLLLRARSCEEPAAEDSS